MDPEVPAEWGRRVVAEYRSAAHAHALTGWLVEIAASPDLIRAGLRIVDDELTHAELSADVLAAAGGAVLAPVPRASLRLPPAEPLEVAVLRAGIELFCLGETVAVPLFRRMLSGATEPVARAALRRIVADEARHRRFGWDLLDWMRGQAPALVDAVIVEELPRMFASVRRAYGEGTRAEIPEEQRAWGLLAPAEYAAVLRRVERDWWAPRLQPGQKK